MPQFRKDIGKAGILDPFQPTLNECLWENEKLKPEVRNDIIKIANELAEITGVEISDLLIYGGAAGYQYSSESDIDVSVYPNYNEEIEKNYEKILDIFRGRIEEICGMELHFFLKGINEKERREASESVYDIINDAWITKPQKCDFNPYERWADKIMEAEKIESMLKQQLADLKLYLSRISSIDQATPILTKFAEVISKLRIQRKEEHLSLRDKAVQEDVSVEDRATQNEITWKHLDKAGILKVLDLIKDSIDQNRNVEIKNVVDENIDPIHQDLY